MSLLALKCMTTLLFPLAEDTPVLEAMASVILPRASCSLNRTDPLLPPSDPGQVILSKAQMSLTDLSLRATSSQE